jgi:hypothetical protein
MTLMADPASAAPRRPERALSTGDSRRARRGRLIRKAVFGDWHPLLRDPLDLLRLSFVAAAVAFFFADSLEYAVRLAATFLVLVAAQRLRLPRLFDLLFIIAMGLQAWGNALRLFEDIDWWDNLVHFVLPAASVPVLYVLNWRLGLLPAMAEERQPRQRLGLVLFAIMNGLSAAAGYEIYEYVAVNWLDADLAIGYSDTIFDLALGVGGAVAGGVLLMLWSAERWPTGRQALR